MKALRAQRLVLAAGFALAAGLAQAHKPSDSYLTLHADGATLRGQWDIALRDLEYAVGLDANADGQITWGELRARHAEIAAYALARLALKADDRPCRLSPTGHLLDDHSDGAYAVLRFTAQCEALAYGAIEVDYRLFFDLDPTHRGLLRVADPEGDSSAVLGPERPRLRLAIGGSSRLAQFRSYAREGVWHIWIGFDHILFLLSLLLPAVLAVSGCGSQPVARFAPAFWDVFLIATSFTVAHSITLSCAALGLIELPSRLVESGIALSVLLAALNNLHPVVSSRRWAVAFAFGLVHGLGFASVLADLGLPSNALLVALLGFNLGVEAGQLAIVSAFLPLAYALRGTWFYRKVVLAGGSAAIALLAAIWLVERAFNLKIALI